ncbi:hypothetical protein LX36DRAFT_709339 [Colletotrichum falcatum]|nr:hypothetical protein LX36DRAFT_709339 [Colletotrichum falcatum]
MKSFAVVTAALLGLANAVSIQICKDQTQGNCKTIDVVGCTNFPGDMNDQVSSVNTGSTQCVFFE